jgi:hypothetical protein
MLKAELDRKTFLVTYIPFFNEMVKSRFEQIYKYFVPKFLSKNDMVYQENATADTFYLLYLGECIIKKNIISNQGQITNKPKNINIMKLERGDIAGLESLDIISPDGEVNLEKKTFYKFSLIANDENTVLISIKVSYLNELLDGFFHAIHCLKTQKEKIIHELLEKKLNLLKKNKITYRKDLFDLHIKQIKEKEIQLNHSKVEDYIKGLPKVHIPKNAFKNFKVTEVSTDETFLERYLKKAENPDYHQTLSRKKNNFTTENIQMFNSSFYKTIEDIKINNTLKEELRSSSKNLLNTNYSKKITSETFKPIKLAVQNIVQQGQNKEGTMLSFANYFQNIKNTLSASSKQISNSKENTTAETYFTNISWITPKNNNDCQETKDQNTNNIINIKSKSTSKNLITIATNYKLQESSKHKRSIDRGSFIDSVQNTDRSNNNGDKKISVKSMNNENQNRYRIRINHSINKSQQPEHQKFSRNVLNFKGTGAIVDLKRRNLEKKTDVIVLNKGLKNSLCTWKSTLDNMTYDSGTFEIPLVSLSNR